MSQEIPPELSGESREEYSPVGEDQDYNGAKVELRRKEQKGKKQR